MKRNICVSYTCVCGYIHHTEEASEMSCETRRSPGPPRKITEQQQMGAPFGRVGCEQNSRSNKQEKDGEELMSWATLHQREPPAPASGLLYTHCSFRRRFLRAKCFA